MEDVVGGLGVIVMIGALVLYMASLASGSRLSGGGLQRELHARLRIGSFALVFFGAGLFILSRPADYAIPAAVGAFGTALLIALMTFAIRLR